MKDFQIIIDFRVAYQKCDYINSDMTIKNLGDWVEEWCSRNSIPIDLWQCFQSLAMAYTDKEFEENLILREMKKGKKKTQQKLR